MHIGEPGSKRQLTAIGALALAVVGVDYVAFRAFDTNYFGWYLSGGPLIQLVFAGFAIAVDLERRPLLISAAPNVFLAEAWAVAGESFIAFSRELKPEEPRLTREDLPRSAPLDDFFAALFYLAFFATFTAWAVIVAPLQYVGNLIAGAPVRLALASPFRTYVVRDGKRIHVGYRRVETLPLGAEVVGLARSPVATTASITAALLFAIGS
jgi:hypothetical protein